MKIHLYKVGRNLNRAIRTCYAFGINELYLCESESKVKGNLYSAKDVKLINVELPNPDTTLVLEYDGKTNLQDIDLSKFENVLIGGESVNLTSKMGMKVKIFTENNFCLTVEAALAVFLYELKIKSYEKQICNK